jgi:uncharacterized protein YdeI (YjbR/CyaY-like superfamily)
VPSAPFFAPIRLGISGWLPSAAAAFLAGLSHTHQLAYVLWIEDAKKPETRSARVVKAVQMLSEHRTR